MAENNGNYAAAARRSLTTTPPRSGSCSPAETTPVASTSGQTLDKTFTRINTAELTKTADSLARATLKQEASNARSQPLKAYSSHFQDRDLDPLGDLDKAIQDCPEHQEAVRSGALDPNCDPLSMSERELTQRLVQQMNLIVGDQNLLQVENTKRNAILDEILERCLDFVMKAKVRAPSLDQCNHLYYNLLHIKQTLYQYWTGHGLQNEPNLRSVSYKITQTEESWEGYIGETIEQARSRDRQHQIILHEQTIDHARQKFYAARSDQQRLVAKQEREMAEKKLHLLRQDEETRRRRQDQARLRHVAIQTGEVPRPRLGQNNPFKPTPPVRGDSIPVPRKLTFDTVDEKGGLVTQGRFSPVIDENEPAWQIEERLVRQGLQPPVPTVDLYQATPTFPTLTPERHGQLDKIEGTDLKWDATKYPCP